MSASKPWFTITAAETAVGLQTDLAHGLSAGEVQRRRERHGWNELPAGKRRSRVAMLVAQFRSLVVALLVLAGAVALVMGDVIEAAAILTVIALNAVIGFVTEVKAEDALASLRQQLVPTAHVVRDGVAMQVPARDLVPGDVVVLQAGARVPADGRLADARELRVEESALTGESVPVSKHADAIADADASIADQRNMVHLATAVVAGHGRFIVTATGSSTEVGVIGRLLADAETRRAPIEDKMAQLARLMIVVVLALAGVIVLSGWLRGNDFLKMLEVGISLAIAAVPEGLPAVTTMTLALGMRRMARMNALVKRLPAVETLGSTTVICSDKTGTLTRNEMTVRVLHLDGRRIDVTGAGYAARGDFRSAGAVFDPLGDDDLALALRIGALCNDATLDRRDDRTEVLGDPTEAALVVAAEKAGLDQESLASDWPRIAELPFSSEAKRMTTVHRSPGGKLVAFVKGSPGTVLGASASHRAAGVATPMTDADRERWEGVNRDLAREALRVLGLAYRELPDAWSISDVDHDLVYVGQVGMSDPLREEAAETIARCKAAGIRTIMITGDQPATAAEIARQLGLDRDAAGRTLQTVHARELALRDDDALRSIVDDAAVFARVSPADKLRIVRALQGSGNVVAMTGDGVNDAPALKQADIGVAMGIKGTEVAKEAADMIITDDNFTTIVAAVEQGRVIVHNILRFIHYLFSCNLAEIVTVFVAILLDWPLPLLALQILWLNMITDVFPALALAFEPSAPDTMTRKPRDIDEPLMTRSLMSLVAWQGLLIAGVVLAAFRIGMGWHGPGADGLKQAGTIAFMALALAQLVHALNARSRTRSAFDRLFTNVWLWGAIGLCVALQIAAVHVPLLRRVLHTAPLDFRDWLLVTAAAMIPFAVTELAKWRASAAASALSTRP